MQPVNPGDAKFGALAKSQTSSGISGVETFERTAQRLAAKFAIHSEVVRVPTLSKMLGILGNAIYGQMRSGTFPLPHKKVGNVVVVRFDDVVQWLRSDWEAHAVRTVRAGPRSMTSAKLH